MKHIDTREAISLLKSMTWVLCAVGILALVFTTVNVTRFATSRSVPLPIAILLDPMIGTALAGVLYVDARLASWGISPPAWSTTLRWGAGCTAALMNSWESLWPDGQIGWPHKADPAAVLLHLTPALLLIGLTETIAAYRRCITDLMDPTHSPNPMKPSRGRPTMAIGSTKERPGSNATVLNPLNAMATDSRSGHQPAATGVLSTDSTHHARPRTGGRTIHGPSPTPASPPGSSGATDADVWPRALALNDAARASTGKPVSVWKLRTDLRIGPRRARQIHDQLLAREADPSLSPE
ncbi:extensin [Streptomyces sp. NPDC001848]|uniref:extensin n=1 Tax=Streptomyces sp. NPDC001848 TaxID=3364618 RepID=UPI0036903836